MDANLRGRAVYTVSEVNKHISDLFAGDAELTDIAVRGEISNFTNHASSGHFYFSIKDAGSRLSCVMFRNNNRYLKFMPAQGMSVVARGYVASYLQRGEYQLYVTTLEKEGTGDLFKKFMQMKEKLEKAGYFDEKRKKPIPVLPRRIGIVTAPEGSVICDIINILGRRFNNMPLLIAPVYVQGNMAADSISAAIGYLNGVEDVDVIILARGGGSIEELWPFNEEKVANAIYDSRKPVISAVGHQTDFTISDFVSDLRAPTPSAAAELVVFSRDEKIAYMAGLARRIEGEARGAVERAKLRLENCNRKLSAHSPGRILENYGMHLDNIEMRMRSALLKKLSALGGRLSELDPRAHAYRLKTLMQGYRSRLAAAGKSAARALSLKAAASRTKLEETWLKFTVYDYKKVLGVGYSIIKSLKSDKIIRSVNDVAEGDAVVLKLADGELRARIE